MVLSDDEEVISQARGHIEHLNAMIRCELPLHIPLVASARDSPPEWRD